MAVEVVGEVDVGGEIAVKVGQVCLHRVLFEETSRQSSTCLEDLRTWEQTVFWTGYSN